MPFSDYIVYVDESGDHGLERINPQSPVFVLAFCVFEKAEYRNVAVPAVQALKFDFWGHDCVVLHSHEIRHQRGEFRILNDQELRGKFLERVNGTIEAMPVLVIAVAIEKQRLRNQYVEPADPYPISLVFCMERLQRHLIELGQAQATTHVIVERRGRKEDRDLELAFRRICDGHNLVGEMPNLDIRFMDKKHNSAGLQIADLVAYPIARHVINPDQENRAYERVERKFRRGPGGQILGYGLKIFP